jgi:hypothetical protein
MFIKLLFDIMMNHGCIGDESNSSGNFNDKNIEWERVEKKKKGKTMS